MNYMRSIPEYVDIDRRLGRHVNHDPRSLYYQVDGDGTFATVQWDRKVPVFDQGALGSCTGNAAVGVLGSEPLYAGLESRIAAGGLALDEAEAVAVYSHATQLDGAPGTYPPTDTGSDGLSAAKACKSLGLIGGYRHILSLSAALTAIQSGPFIVGSNWYEGMDTPDAAGVVTATGQVRGGHEYECVGYDVAAEMWTFVNSWGSTWGDAGRFRYSTSTFARLLSEDGDATVFTAANEPPPMPVAPDVADATLAAAARHWTSTPKLTRANRAMADSLTAWLTAKGLPL